MAERECGRPGCHNRHKAKGLCMRHYHEQWRADPVNRARKNAYDRRYGQRQRRTASDITERPTE